MQPRPRRISKRLYQLPAWFAPPSIARVAACARLSGLGFVDRQASAEEFLALHVFNRAFEVPSVLKSHEAESARLSGVAVRHDLHFFHGVTMLFNPFFQSFFGRGETQISNKKFVPHVLEIPSL